jgi:hypothetical protein
MPIKPSYLIEEPETISNVSSVKNIVKPKSYLSSPLLNEELIVPLTIDEKTMDKYTLTPRRHHKQKKTHKTYRVYKKNKSSPKSKTKSKPKSRGKSAKSFTLF